ncbi:Hypothetical Protein FCC1311_032842 [Hondaea fermentalgiana]|uniref:Uncharacterized protein n=1 Tax=Hondaea fermentalgiana TaxID=2315210 RepID=A0A2R5GFP7_9STRA|nr:Hypothetical Protein FCC1311_032842 [Hondaea fermentalgiana]|eukprot:GBG27061.1 Hypothetical Protein FCC1311_032842 [Hondaea fermentalgiana]
MGLPPCFQIAEQFIEQLDDRIGNLKESAARSKYELVGFIPGKVSDARHAAAFLGFEDEAAAASFCIDLDGACFSAKPLAKSSGALSQESGNKDDPTAEDIGAKKNADTGAGTGAGAGADVNADADADANVDAERTQNSEDLVDLFQDAMASAGTSTAVGRDKEEFPLVPCICNLAINRRRLAGKRKPPTPVSGTLAEDPEFKAFLELGGKPLHAPAAPPASAAPSSSGTGATATKFTEPVTSGTVPDDAADAPKEEESALLRFLLNEQAKKKKKREEREQQKLGKAKKLSKKTKVKPTSKHVKITKIQTPPQPSSGEQAAPKMSKSQLKKAKAKAKAKGGEGWLCWCWSER